MMLILVNWGMGGGEEEGVQGERGERGRRRRR